MQSFMLKSMWKANTLKRPRKRVRRVQLVTGTRSAYDVIKFGRSACRNLKGRVSNYIRSI